MTVETYHGKTSGSVAYYAAGDERVLAIFERFVAGKVDEDQVKRAVKKIAGVQRIEADWKEAGAPNEWIRGPEVFEAWLSKQPEELKRIYGNPEVIAGVIIQSKEGM